ncbi:MAG TPA: DUF541 domain-containing protein [Gammaproteobacteria bacterium]|nr:DUF541 domain-containing protein [Gammaproteobacteria bacterium]
MRISRLCLQMVLLLAFTLLSGVVAARDETSFNRFDFQVKEIAEVENDRMMALLRVEETHPDPARLAEIVNQAMTWALAEADRIPEVEAATGDYRVRAVMKDGLIVDWRAYQQLTLKGTDSAAVSRLVGRLQNRLRVGSIGFELTPQRRRAAEDRLIGSALDAFKARARLIADNFGARDYRIIKVSINTAAHDVRPMAMLQSVEKSAVHTPPAVREGSSRVEVRVSGTIELK